MDLSQQSAVRVDAVPLSALEFECSDAIARKIVPIYMQPEMHEGLHDFAKVKLILSQMVS